MASRWSCALIGVLASWSTALHADGVSRLPTDIRSLLSLAGVWQPVATADLTGTYNGTLANTFHAAFPGRYGDNVVLTGWAFKTDAADKKAVTPVHLAILAQGEDGRLRLATEDFVSATQTQGGGSIVVADFNQDGRADIFLATHNETPFLARPSTVLLSKADGRFDTVQLNDKVMAHDAELATLDGVPTVITKTFSPGDASPFYQFVNGSFKQTFPSNLGGVDPLGTSVTSGMSIALSEMAGSGRYGVAIGDFTFGPGYPWSEKNPFAIAVYPWEKNGIASQPAQIIPGYFNSRAQYANVKSEWGYGNTHTYRLWVDDFNQDGLPDLLAGASLWSAASPVFPAALQLLQNQGGYRFSDVSDTLGKNLGVVSQEFEYSMQLRDVDNSGVKSYLSAVKSPQDCSKDGCPAIIDAHSNFVLVNDGTGTLHVALHSLFSTWGDQVWDFVRANQPGAIIGPQRQPTPKFFAYQTAAGKLNFLALASIGVAEGGRTIDRWALVNVPVSLDLATDFTTPLVVSSRNGSRRIRTFAGDDVIYAGEHVGKGSVDGGLGFNTMIYPGAFKEHQGVKNADGSWDVVDVSGKSGSDQLRRIQKLRFSDVELLLDGTEPADRVMNWAERAYPSVFPESQSSRFQAGYFFRAYSNGTLVGASQGRLLVLNTTLFGPKPLDVGRVEDFLAQAKEAGF